MIYALSAFNQAKENQSKEIQDTVTFIARQIDVSSQNGNFWYEYCLGIKTDSDYVHSMILALRVVFEEMGYVCYSHYTSDMGHTLRIYWNKPKN